MKKMNHKEEQAKAQPAPDPGIFVTKGMQVSVPEFSIRINPDGTIDASPLVLHTGVDMCPFWLEIAYEQLLKTEAANDDLMAAKKEDGAEKIAEALKTESSYGMQTIMSSAVAMEAYYANVKAHITIPIELIEAWRKNKTARYLQIAEVLKIAFIMSGASANQIREILKQNFTFRNKAVHPPTGTTAPALHPELNKVTDWRFGTFRYFNAKNIAGVTLSIIAQTARHPHTEKYEGLKTYCETLSTQIKPIITLWESRYGQLFKTNDK